MANKYTMPRPNRFKKDKQSCSFRLPEDLLAFYKKRAEELGMSMTDLVQDILDKTADSIDPERKLK